MKDKLQALDADLKTEADAYNIIQKGTLHQRYAAAAMLGTPCGSCSCCAFSLHLDRRCCVGDADINKNGDARRKFTQQLQENEMVLQASAGLESCSSSKHSAWQLAHLCTLGTGSKYRHLCKPCCKLYV